MPSATSLSIWPIGVPCMHAITITSRRHQSQWISGTSSMCELAKLRRSWLALAASAEIEFVVQVGVEFGDHFARFEAFCHRQQAFDQSAMKRSSARSCSMVPAGCRAQNLDRHLGAVGQFGEMHWATEALAIGVASKRLNTCSGGLPYAAIITSRALIPGGIGATRSCSSQFVGQVGWQHVAAG